ncbi:uncharacterized protein LOC125769468 [Anopheles funestus]|uniref:uncharacterized protein LOC125769468 n=1 Tax=Anopheles funestus TaxID=62324 RepID=UPI0020C63EA3|nr:uncharacterized protein LOC125769468 [Anopheles funestus]
MYKGDQTAFWEEVVQHLNALGPSIRTGATWKRLRQNRASLLATGGGPFHQKPLNDIEERVASLTNLKATIAGNSGHSYGMPKATAISNNNDSNKNDSNNNDCYIESNNNHQPDEDVSEERAAAPPPGRKRRVKRKNTEEVLRQNQQMIDLMRQSIGVQKQQTEALRNATSAIERATELFKNISK